MWFVPSRERPHKLARFIRAFEASGAETPLAVIVDETEPRMSDYRDVVGRYRLIVRPGETVGMAEKCRYAFEVCPDLDWYGFLPDDCEPITCGWDHAMIAAAGPNAIAFANTGHKRAKNCILCFGGDLLRKFGGVIPPGLEHYGGDRFWREVGLGLGRYHFLDQYLVRLTDRLAGEPPESWDAPKRRMKARQTIDKAVYREMRNSGYIDQVIKALQ